MSSWQTLLLLVIVLFIGKFFIVYILSRFLGYHRKTAFLVGAGLLQISEFGFIIAKEGLNLSALTNQEYTLLIALVIVAIFGSVPITAHGSDLYYRCMRFLGKRWKKFFLDTKDETTEYAVPIEKHIIICGYGRVGKYIGRALQMANIPFVVIDYNHATALSLRQKSIDVVYGDPADINVLEVGQVKTARALIIAIPDRHTQELIISNALTLNRNIKIICRTHHEEDQAALKLLGVTTIVQPEFEAALSIINKLLPDYGVTPEELSGKVSRLKIEHGLG
jgi:CPA2 family monovalent cation:H+ antiporter-2